MVNIMFYIILFVFLHSESLNQQTFYMEVEVLKQMRHNHLISLFAICTSSTPYYIITEYMEKGNLLDFLRSKSSLSSLIFLWAMAQKQQKRPHKAQRLSLSLYLRTLPFNLSFFLNGSLRWHSEF